MATNNLVNSKGGYSQKPEILINIDAEESILTSPGKKLNSIIKNISNFIFAFQEDDSLILPRYNQDISIQNKELEHEREERAMKEEQALEQAWEQQKIWEQQKAREQQKAWEEERERKWKEQIDIENKIEIFEASENLLPISLFLKENKIVAKERNKLFPRWDIEAQKYLFN